MTINIPELEAKAKAATPGEWVLETETRGYEIATIHGIPPQPTDDRRGQAWIYLRPQNNMVDSEPYWADETTQLDNAQYLSSANPATILALCAELRALKEDLKEINDCRHSDNAVAKFIPDRTNDAIDRAEAALERLKEMGVE